MASEKTLRLRTPKHPVMMMVCARCLRQNKHKSHTYVGGTLQRSEYDGLLYHPEHLPERHLVPTQRGRRRA